MEKRTEEETIQWGLLKIEFFKADEVKKPELTKKLFKFVNKIISEMFFRDFIRLNEANSHRYLTKLTVEKHKKEPDRMKFINLNSF